MASPSRALFSRNKRTGKSILTTNRSAPIPATLIPGGRFDKIDLVLVRENNEGLYMGYGHFIPIDADPHAVGMSTGVNTRQGCRRICHFAFEYALRKGRKKVTVVHKASIMKALS